MILLPDERNRLEIRSTELINSIRMINSFDPYLRKKYYVVMLHSIDLLKQYTRELSK